MKSTKWLAVLAAASIIVLPACGGSGGTAAKKEEAKTVQFWYSVSGTNADVLKGLVDDYNKSHSNKVNATLVPPGERLQKLTAAIGAGNPPDLFTAGPPDLAALLGSKSLAPIDELGKGKQDKLAGNRFFESMQKLTVADGKLWAVPVETGVMGLYYNEDMFKKAGITKAPETWEELVDAARKLAKDGKNGILLPTAAEQFTGQTWLQFLYQAGGQMLTDDLKQAAFNSPEGVKALQLWVDLVHKYKAAPLQQLNNVSIPQTFAAGNSGMFISHPAWIDYSKNFSFKTKTARLPGDKKFASTLGGWYIVIPAKSQAKEAAYDFLAWLSKPENNVKWNIGMGSLPTNQATLDRPEYQKFMKDTPLVEPFIASFKKDAIVPQPTPLFSQITVLISKAINEALYQKSTPQEALNKAADEVNKLLKEQ